MVTKNKEQSDISISQFGYRLIRQELLSELLGTDKEQLLYWAGKSLARKFPRQSIEEICHFFKEADWGELTLVKEKKAEYTFQLVPVLNQCKEDFKLEAGFIAEQIQNIKDCITETKMSSKKQSIIFTVQSDIKDTIN